MFESPVVNVILSSPKLVKFQSKRLLNERSQDFSGQAEYLERVIQGTGGFSLVA